MILLYKTSYPHDAWYIYLLDQYLCVQAIFHYCYHCPLPRGTFVWFRFWQPRLRLLLTHIAMPSACSGWQSLLSSLHCHPLHGCLSIWLGSSNSCGSCFHLSCHIMQAVSSQCPSSLRFHDIRLWAMIALPGQSPRSTGFELNRWGKDGEKAKVWIKHLLRQNLQ